jgi:hypothetical protein
MRYFVLHPEVPGGIDEDCQGDFAIQPPRIDELVIYFDDWLGDDLLTTFPVFYVTASMASQLKGSNLSGFSLASMRVKRSELFDDLHTDEPLELVEFAWLQVNGEPGIDDFGVTNKTELVVSERALSILFTGRLNQGRVSPFGG